MHTRPSSPSRHCTHWNHFNPPGNIPEQLAAYSVHARRLKQYHHGINCLAQGQTKVPRPGIEPVTYWLLVRNLTNWATLFPLTPLTSLMLKLMQCNQNIPVSLFSVSHPPALEVYVWGSWNQTGEHVRGVYHHEPGLRRTYGAAGQSQGALQTTGHDGARLSWVHGTDLIWNLGNDFKHTINTNLVIRKSWDIWIRIKICPICVNV